MLPASVNIESLLAVSKQMVHWPASLIGNILRADKFSGEEQQGDMMHENNMDQFKAPSRPLPSSGSLQVLHSIMLFLPVTKLLRLFVGSIG